MTLFWRNQDHIRKWFFYSKVITPEQHQNWFEGYQERDDDFVFIIEEIRAGFRPVGQIALYHIDWAALRAEYGRIMIGEADAAGRGLARAASLAVLEIARQQLGLREIYLEVYADNTRAISLYETVGFKTEKLCDNIITMRVAMK